LEEEARNASGKERESEVIGRGSRLKGTKTARTNDPAGRGGSSERVNEKRKKQTNL